MNNRKSVVNLQPRGLKKGATLLIELFKLIENNYDINEDNERKLNKISKLIQDWMNGGIIDVRVALEMILENMHINLSMWPQEQQGKIDYIWTRLITVKSTRNF